MGTPFLGLRTAIYRVNDLSKAIEWYSKILGITQYFNETFYVGLNVGGDDLGLQPEEGPGIPRGENVETYWGVDDVQAVFDHLLASGATAHMQPSDVGGGIVVATVKDPWSNVFGIIKNPHFGM